MKILLIGRAGQLGWELQRALAPLGEMTSLGSQEIDLADLDATAGWVRQVRPDVVINAGAYTAVDQAESEREQAHAVNALAPGVLAAETKAVGGAFIHYSTDFVFDGIKTSPYIESDPTNPISAYGQTKLDGEKLVRQAGGSALILRTAWVYSTRRPSFVTKVLEWSRKFPLLRMVTDQTGSPTWCRMLAEATAAVLAMAGPSPAGWLGERAGLYHLACTGEATRMIWAQAILRHDPHPEEQTAKAVLPATTADFPAPAARPAYSVLNSDRFYEVFGLRLPAWEDALRLAMEAA